MWQVGTSSDLRVGQSCYAIGNPFGLGATLTAGLVSGLNRTIPSPAGRPITGAIQTDAAINAGNSGGPLLDSYGRLIGVSSATFTRSGSVRIYTPSSCVVHIQICIRTYTHTHRETQTETKRQRDRETDRQKDRQTDRETHSHRATEPQRHRETET
jgi:hypothetical protein